MTHDGERLYMTFNSYESFLAKLDMVYKELERWPAEYTPVKYSNSGDKNLKAHIVNVFIAALFVTFIIWIYKSKNGKGMSTGKKAGKPANKDKKGGEFFGGGGLNDIFWVDKSNAK